MSYPIGFAVVGTGMIAEVHAQAIKDTPEARLVAVWTRAADKRNEFAQRFHVPEQAARGGAETMYPEYRKKMKDAAAK